MTRGFVEAIGFSVSCASSVREGFTLKSALRKSYKPQPFRGFVGAIGFSDMFEKGS
jgi:hypothetical protein